MIKKAIEKVIKLWKEVTGEDIQEMKHRFSLGKDYNYILHEAMNYLDEDSTGLLSSLKLREAFKEFSSKAYLTLEQLLNGEWDENKDTLVELEHTIYCGVIGDAYNTFTKSLLKNIKAFGKEMTQEQFNKIEKIEDVLVKSVLNFNKPYKFKHERFNQGEIKKGDATILRRLFRFNSFEEFVDSLKVTEENNFICVALCDRTFRENDNSEYDNKYDSQFAIGLKNNGVVITVSDRNVLESPSGEYKGRNPGREFWNKVDYDYLPYYKLEDIEDATEGKQQLRLTYKEEINTNDGNLVVDLFDDVGIVYITTLLTLVYKKYFTDVNDSTELQFFGKDIKLLPASSSRELMVVDGKLELPAVPKDSNYTTYLEDPKDEYGIHNHGLYDWLLNEYPPEEDVTKTPVKFIGTKEQAQRNIWWQVRNAQKEHIQKCLEEEYHRQNIEDWFMNAFTNNIESIVDYIIKTPEYDNIDKYRLDDFPGEKSNKNLPFVWECYRDNIPMDLSSIQETGENIYDRKRYKFKSWHPTFSCDSIFGKVNGIYYGGYCPVMWFENDNDNRYYELTLILRTWDELKKFFNVKELPKQLKRWINMHSGGYGSWAWEPYSGNSILNFTDPMNRMKIPANGVNFYVKLNMSKTMYNKIQKLHKIS